MLESGSANTIAAGGTAAATLVAVAAAVAMVDQKHTVATIANIDVALGNAVAAGGYTGFDAGCCADFGCSHDGNCCRYCCCCSCDSCEMGVGALAGVEMPLEPFVEQLLLSRRGKLLRNGQRHRSGNRR